VESERGTLNSVQVTRGEGLSRAPQHPMSGAHGVSASHKPMSGAHRLTAPHYPMTGGHRVSRGRDRGRV
jgi:hypothetical protein